MRNHDPSPMPKLSRPLALSMAFAMLALSLSLSVQAQTESVIYNFRGGPHPNFPSGGLTFDAAGNLYGTAATGGTFNLGAVFKLTPISGGGWQETTLHSFSGGLDGADPHASLIIDGAGNLFGATGSGGASNLGTVYELSPITGGGWHETVLHSFTGGIDGSDPATGLVFDSAGNLYGTAAGGGSHSQGTVFELSPLTTGDYHFTVLHAFTGGTDGGDPAGTLVFDSLGNLYGTTEAGGIVADCTSRGQNGCGVVFELSPVTGGGWHETVLHAFNDTNGGVPLAGVTFDTSGNLYGTTFVGGNLSDCLSFGGCGVVFELSPITGGWQETVIHAFTGSSDGANPTAGVTLDSLGNVYGSTQTGGSTSGACNAGGCGLVFEFSFSAGSWHETVLHAFTSTPDGTIANGKPIFDTSGNLYSTTAGGGTFNHGTVFEITP